VSASWHAVASGSLVIAAESRVQQLLDEISDSGCTPEEVCSDYPELLPEVRRRWRQMCAVKAELHALFPTPRPDPGSGADTPAPWPAGVDLPQIPGYEVEALLGRGGMGLVYNELRLFPRTSAMASPRVYDWVHSPSRLIRYLL
jgi:serine/threonine-protein kinase